MTTLLFCGDIVLGDGPTDFVQEDLQAQLAAADLAIANLEAPVRTHAPPIPKAGPHLAQPVDAPARLRAAGFGLVSLANNHAWDYGDLGLMHTLDALIGAGLPSVGAGLTYAEAAAPFTWANGRERITFLAACEAEFGCYTQPADRAGYAWLGDASLPDRIREAKAGGSFVCVLAHAGVEGVPLPLPYWRAHYRQLCAAGADLVVGSHPHVPQGYERWGDSLIFYSLGNFYFGHSAANRFDRSFAVRISLQNGQVAGVTCLPHQQRNGRVGLYHDPDFSTYLESLSAVLADDTRYTHLAYQQSLYLYRTRYVRFYRQVAAGADPREGVGRTLLNLYRQVFRPEARQRARQLLLLHNLRIESHRHAVQMALEGLVEQDRPADTAEWEALWAQY